MTLEEAERKINGQYYDDNGKRKKISAKTIEDLKRKVISKSLLWEKF